jgi:putative phage-type endonuclease
MSHRFKYWFLKQSSTEWEEIHRKDWNNFILTASVCPRIFGCDPGDSAAHQYDLYRGNKQEKAFNEFSQQAVDWGKHIEPTILKEFYKTHPDMTGVNPGLILHPKYDWLGASMDNIAVRCGFLVNIECKGQYYSNPIVSPLDIKHKYYCQIQAQMMCCPSILQSVLVCYHKDEKIARAFTIIKNKPYIDLLEQGCVEFKQWVMGERKPDEMLKWRFGRFKREYFKKLDALFDEAIKHDIMLV